MNSDDENPWVSAPAPDDNVPTCDPSPSPTSDSEDEREQRKAVHIAAAAAVGALVGVMIWRRR